MRNHLKRLNRVTEQFFLNSAAWLHRHPLAHIAILAGFGAVSFWVLGA